jgi:hypothetical protein
MQAIVFANTDNSLAASLSLLDQDEFADQVTITEYPILTALSRNTNPSAESVNKLKTYLQAQKPDNKYLRKLYLIYSALVKTRCQNNVCDESTLVSTTFWLYIVLQTIIELLIYSTTSKFYVN